MGDEVTNIRFLGNITTFGMDTGCIPDLPSLEYIP